jgi:Polyketide cyclase / dehydrase and lipid transport
MTSTIEIHQDFPFSVDKVFSDLADHESFGRILGVPMVRIIDGVEGGRNGVGSVRRVGPPVLGCEETVVTHQANALIEYKVTKGGPIKNHFGRMTFSATPQGSHLHYVITFESKIPFAGSFIRNTLEKVASQGLRRYAHG